MDVLMEVPLDNVPPELKATCEQILKRAREVRKREPVVAYWCCFSAASASLPIQRSKEGTAFLMKLLTVLEEMKKHLLAPGSGVEPATINDEAAGSACVEQLAMKVFMQADDEDRAGKASKTTVRNFVIAAQYIEVLRCFEPPNGMREEMEQKLQYAKWKAGDIAKALREGRTPTAGPPVDPLEAELAQIQNAQQASSSGSQPVEGSSSPGSSGAGLPPPPALPALRPVPSRLDSQDTDSGAWSTVATPGAKDVNGSGDGGFPYLPGPPAGDASDLGDRSRATSAIGTAGSDAPSTPRASGSFPSSPSGRPRRSSSNGERKAVRFAGPDGAPLSPTETVGTLPPEAEETVAPPPTIVDDDDTGTTASTAPSLPSKTAKPASTVVSDQATAGSASPYAASTPLQPAHQPSQPPVATSISYPTPSAPPALPVAPPQTLDTKSIERVQKHARWAVSALDYEDLDTARAELRKALAILG